ncbi:MAG: hypothetical protein M1379_00935 [Firmicutes bacterium]|nr:hypothetical protein [Bacillota bacterium]
MPELVSKEQIEKWKKEFEGVYELRAETDDDKPEEVPLTLYFKRPGREELSRFAKSAAGETLKATSQFVFDCRLYPDEQVLRKLFEEKPGLAISIGNKLSEIVGVNQVFTVKRL